MTDPIGTTPISPLRQRLIDDMNVRRLRPCRWPGSHRPPFCLCDVNTSTWRSFATISSGLWRFLDILVLLSA
jgi:hypothetical protein